MLFNLPHGRMHAQGGSGRHGLLSAMQQGLCSVNVLATMLCCDFCGAKQLFGAHVHLVQELES